MKDHIRTKPDGRKVKVDSRPENSYDDGYNAARRKAKDDIKLLEHELSVLENEIAFLEGKVGSLQRKERLASLLLAALAGGLLVFLAYLASNIV